MDELAQIRRYAIDTIQSEANAVIKLEELLTDDFAGAVKTILACTGKVVVTGMGKSGLVGKKIAATLASTGTPAFFMHPGEAFHGDLGMVQSNDVVIAIANSGQTDEILKLIPFFESHKNVVIAITGNPQSTLAKHSKYCLNIAVEQEACPLNLAPTSSTTTTMVMGDALAVALMKMRNFQPEDFAQFHPGGTLGRRLLTKVKDVMRKENLALVSTDTLLGDVIIAISNARLGIAAVVDRTENGDQLLGVITDGDIRRAMAKYRGEFFNVKASEVMSRKPKTIKPEERVVFAEQIMHGNKINSLIVVNPQNCVLGVLEYFNVSATI